MERSIAKGSGGAVGVIEHLKPRRRFILGLTMVAIAATGCAGNEGEPNPAPAVSPAGSAAPSEPAPSGAEESPTPSPEDRAARDPIVGVIDGFTHGGRYYGVYVFVGSPDDPDLHRSIRRLERMGLIRGVNFSDGDLGCDEGARERLELSAEEARGGSAVAVYFEDEADAQGFAATLDPPPVGIARVRTLCAD